MQNEHTPLHVAACYSKHPEILKVLIDSKANIEAKDKVTSDSRWWVGGWGEGEVLGELRCVLYWGYTCTLIN